MEKENTTNSTDQQKPFSLDDIDVANFAVNTLSAIVGKNTEQTVKAITHKDIMGNVAIFVDYDNIYWTLQNNYAHDPDSTDTTKNLFDSLWRRYGNDNVRTFRAYADFQKIKTSLTSLQKKRVQIRHVYSNDKQGDHRKNSSDIELCIDAIESTYKDPNITRVSESQLTQLVQPHMEEMLREQNKRKAYFDSKNGTVIEDNSEITTDTIQEP